MIVLPLPGTGTDSGLAALAIARSGAIVTSSRFASGQAAVALAAGGLTIVPTPPRIGRGLAAVELERLGAAVTSR